MSKRLRQNEKITFVQTRAPRDLWIHVKRLALEHASDGTITRLCTGCVVEYLAGRCWVGKPWLRPQDMERKSGGTGFQQVNLPLSNLDESGEVILTSRYLGSHGLLDLFTTQSPLSQATIETNSASELIYSAADKLKVSGATFAYSFLNWLVAVKYAESETAKVLELSKLPAATPFVRE